MTEIFKLDREASVKKFVESFDDKVFCLFVILKLGALTFQDLESTFAIVGEEFVFITSERQFCCNPFLLKINVDTVLDCLIFNFLPN